MTNWKNRLKFALWIQPIVLVLGIILHSLVISFGGQPAFESDIWNILFCSGVIYVTALIVFLVGFSAGQAWEAWDNIK